MARGATMSMKRDLKPYVVAALGIVGLVIVAAIVASSLRGGAQAAAGMPSPQAVPVQELTLSSIGHGRVRGWQLPPYSAPRDVVIRPSDGLVWLTEQTDGAVDTFSHGTLVRYEIDKKFPGSGAFALTPGPDGSMWFSGYPGTDIGRVLADGTANSFEAQGQGPTTIGIAEGPGSTIWVAANSAGGLIRISPDGHVGRFPIPFTGGRASTPTPYDVVQGPNASIWFTDPARLSIGEATDVLGTPSIREFPLASGSDPRTLAVGPDGTMWVVLSKARAIGRIDPSTGAVAEHPVKGERHDLNGIAVARDGSLWVTTQGADVLHLSTRGRILERFTLPGGATYADGIAVANDGTVWVAAGDANLLVEIAPRS